MTNPAPALEGVATELQPPQAKVLPRKLGVVALIFIVVAFNAPIATMAGFAQLAVGFGNGIGAPISFFVAGAILMLFAVGFVGMSRYIEHPGAFYRFIVAGIGRPPGLAGAFLATAAYVLLVAGSYVYLGLIALDLARRLTGSGQFSWQIWALIFLVIGTALGLLRMDVSMKVLGTLVAFEIVLVAAYEIVVIATGGPEGYSTASFTPSAFFSGTMGLGVLFAMLTMIGIETAACFRDEARDPDKSVGRATFSAIAFMAVFYGIGIWAYIITQGASHVVFQAQTNPIGSFIDSVHSYLGLFFVNVTATILVTSQLAAINAIQGAASRYIYALGRDNILWSRFARVHGRLESPYVAVLAVTIVSLVMLVGVFVLRLNAVQSYAAMTGAGIYFLLPLFIATSVAVVVFYRRNRQFKASRWTSLVAPGLSVVALGALFVITSMNMDKLVGKASVGLGSQIVLALLAIGGFLLALRYRRTRPDVYERIGNQ